MLNKIILFFKKDNKVIENFTYLTVLKVFAILSPLLVYPYLIDVLGVKLYGKIIFIQSIIVYFSLIINFGFNISGTKLIAENVNNKDMLSVYFTAVFVNKIMLWFLCLIGAIILSIFVDFIREDLLLFIFCFGITVHDCLFPLWFFQGIEKMKYITFINIGVKVFFTLSIFLIVKNQGDYLYVPFLQSLGMMLASFLALYISFKKEKIKFVFYKKAIIKTFKNSVHLFVSQVSIIIYVRANKVIIGAFLGMTEVAIYDLAEKILNFLKIPVGMLGQAAFPMLSRDKSINKINKYMWIGVSISILLVAIVYAFTEEIVFLFVGEELINSVTIIRLLVLSSIFVAFSQYLGTSRLIIFGYRKEFTAIIVSSGVFFSLSIVILYLINEITLSSVTFTSVAIEFWISLVMFIVCFKKKIIYE